MRHGITLNKCIGANPLSGCVSHRGVIDGGDRVSIECVVKVYDFSAYATLPMSALSASILSQSKKCWEVERDVLTRAGQSRVPSVMGLAQQPKLPHLLDSFSISKEGIPPFVNVLSYIPGTPLEDRLKAEISSDPLDETKARKLLLGILESLAILHSNGCVHRDVRPANIIESPDREHISLIDVNFAQLAELTTFTSLEQSSWHVVPPDVHTRNNPLDGDVYAAGAIVIGAMLGEDPGNLLGREYPLYGLLDMPEIAKRLPRISSDFFAILERLCHPDHKIRPKDASAALKLLTAGPNTLTPLPASLEFNRLLSASGRTLAELFEAEMQVARARKFSKREDAREAWCRERLASLPAILREMAEAGSNRKSIGSMTWSQEIARLSLGQWLKSWFANVNIAEPLAPSLRAFRAAAREIGAEIVFEYAWVQEYGGRVMEWVNVVLNVNSRR
jgi:serine/threonine protein kinase